MYRDIKIVIDVGLNIDRYFERELYMHIIPEYSIQSVFPFT